MRRHLLRASVALVGALAALLPSGALASGAGTVGNFSFGELQGETVGAGGCGSNIAGEPAIHVSPTNDVFLGSENGLGSGSELWRGRGALGGAGASGCELEFMGQPNTIDNLGLGASGGDIDIALANAPNVSGAYNVYVASLNIGSVNVATSTDGGATFSQSPIQAGLPLDDREWIAAFGAGTSLLTFHDASGDIDVLRSDNSGQLYTQIAQAIPETDYKAGANEIGNIVIDHLNLPDSSGDFYAYQSFVAPSSPSGAEFNEAFLAVSADGGHTWKDEPIPCSVSSTGLDHNFPNVSVDPAGNVWYAWSDDHNIFTAESTDHGQAWTCSGPVSTTTAQAIFPWLVAAPGGVDLVYYGSPSTGRDQTFYVYFAQDTAGAPSGWGSPEQLLAVHQGTVCESGLACTSGRQLFDDFGVDTDSQGWAHIAYSHDAPQLGGPETFTGYAVQTGGTPIGQPKPAVAISAWSPTGGGEGSPAPGTSGARGRRHSRRLIRRLRVPAHQSGKVVTGVLVPARPLASLDVQLIAGAGHGRRAIVLGRLDRRSPITGPQRIALRVRRRGWRGAARVMALVLQVRVTAPDGSHQLLRRRLRVRR